MLAAATSVIAVQESASDRAYVWAKQRIVDGTFVGGDMISEGDVSEQVGVSRTPVREAFLRLAAEGVLQLFPKRGALVVPITEADVRHVLEARLLIEPWAARVAAELSDRAALVGRLRGHVDDLAAVDRGDDVVAYQEADRAFHEAILAVTGNRLIADFYRSLRDRQLRLGALAVASRAGRSTSILAEHRAIADAIATGDADRAAELVRAHLGTTQRLLAGVASSSG